MLRGFEILHNDEPLSSWERQQAETTVSELRSLICYVTVLQRYETQVCADLTTILSQEQSLDLLKAYHLQRQTWKKGSVLAVLGARKLRAVAVTVLLHHLLRPMVECPLSLLGMGAGSE